MNEPLLTIAIPTYNRADILARTLETLFANPDFDADKIEVVVSDNASTDNTTEVVGRYPRVRYFRNKTNIGSNPNFTVLLSRCRGKYLRLMNDTARFNEGKLGKILHEVEKADPDGENLYFVMGKKHKACEIESAEGFLDVVSFQMTAIANFGVWRADFEKIEDKNRFVDTLLHQVDWLLKMAGNGKKTKIFIDDFLQVEDTKNKGSYDVFDVFVTKYLSILKFHKIGFFSMKIEKYRLFRYFLVFWLNARGDEYTFNLNNLKVIHRHYWYEPYYFPYRLLYKPLKRLTGRCSKK